MSHDLTDPDAPEFLVRKSTPPGLWSSARLSQVVEVRGARLIFLSGQAAADAHYKVNSAQFKDQLNAVFDNIETALKSVGAGLEHIVKTTTYLTDAAFKLEMRAVRAERFKHLKAAPANTALVVKSLIEPEYLVEIDVIAALPLK